MRIGIAGAGLMGRLLAWRLLRRGCRVSLYDADEPSGRTSAGMAAAGMLAALSEAAEGEAAVAALGRGAVAAWQRLLADLAAEGAPPVWLQSRGSLVVAHAADTADLERLRQRLATRVAAERFRVLDATALGDLEPELAGRFGGGLYLPEEGCIDSRQLLASLESAIRHLGGEWHTGTLVEEVAPGQLRLAASCRHFDLAVDCRGAGAVGQWPGLRAVRGELLRIAAPELRLSRPVRLAHPRYQLYIAPRAGTGYVVGATEIDSAARGAVTVRSALELLSALFSLHPAFAEAQILEMNAACRAAFSNHLPQVEATPGLLRVNGLYRHGFLLAPQLLDEALAALPLPQAAPMAAAS